MDRFYTDQEIYNMGFNSRAAFNRRIKAEDAQAKRDQERAANTAVGYEPRRSDRFNGAVDPAVERAFTKSRLYANQQAQVTPTAPPVTPQVVTPVKPKEDFAAAKDAYHQYFKAANSYEKGKAFVEFGIAIGEIPANASGLTGGQAQADRISAVLHDREITAFRYDRNGEIQHAQQIPQQ